MNSLNELTKYEEWHTQTAVLSTFDLLISENSYADVNTLPWLPDNFHKYMQPQL